MVGHTLITNLQKIKRYQKVIDSAYQSSTSCNKTQSYRQNTFSSKICFRMKVFVLTIALLAASAFADTENVDIDWSNVRPIEQYPAFWDDKPASIRPPSSYFAEAKRGRIVGGNIAT